MSSTVLERLKRRIAARRAGRRPIVAPIIVAALVAASFPPLPQLIARERALADAADAKLSLISTNGMFAGFGMIRMMRGGGILQLALTIAVNTFNYDLHAAAIAAGWDGVSPAAITLTVNSTIWVGNNGGATDPYSLVTTGTWPAGTTHRLVNLGNIAGRGGNGGGGGAGGIAHTGGGGTDGKHAIMLGWPITIDNGSGLIASGSGGGGGGADYYTGPIYAGGGGAGGARGYAGGTHGAGNAAAANPGSDGTDGTNANGGVGGPGGHDAFYNVSGGAGGGTSAFFATAGVTGDSTATHSGGLGGNPGVAIFLNGYTITWVAGNDATHVVGTVA